MADTTGYDPSGSGMAAFHLTANLLAHLDAKGIITRQGAKDIVDFALLNLEQSEATAAPSDQARWRYARLMLDGLRQRLSTGSGPSRST